MPLLRPRVVMQDKPGSKTKMIAAGDQDKMLTAVLKWIPVEVIAAYKFIIDLIPSGHLSFQLWSSIAAIPISGLWIAFATQPDGRTIAWRQVILAPIAFACWAVAMQGDMLSEVSKAWEPWMGSVVLGAGMMLLPIFDGILKAFGIPQN
jgi:hypothetical protein